MIDVMLDLETLGVDADAPILSVGAVVMDLVESKFIGTSFYRIVKLDSSGQGRLDVGTLIWWMAPERRVGLFELLSDPRAEELAKVLVDFSSWLHWHSQGKANVRVWGCGSSFDNVILRSAYQRLDLPPPWNSKNDRCYRTVRELFGQGVEMRRQGQHHNALDDAHSQALHLMEILAKSGKET